MKRSFNSKALIILSFLLSGLFGVSTYSQTWEYVGSPSFSVQTASYQSLVFNPADGLPYVAYFDGIGTGSLASVMKFTGSGATGWEPLGTSPVNNHYGRNSSLAFSQTGEPYLAYVDLTHGNPFLMVLKYFASSNAWVVIGDAHHFPAFGDYPDIKVAPDGKAYVAVTLAGNTRVKVNSRGDYWDEASSTMPVLSFIPSADNKLAISSNGTIYVAFRELKGDNNVRVMKLANGIWNDILDGKAIWDNYATNINLAIDPSDQLPVLAFAQAGTALAVVYKYNGTSWNQLGNNSSIGSGECLSMACSPVTTGAVFVANKTNKLKTGLDVKQYNGFEWVALGDPSFNGVSGIYASIAVSASGNPYVAFPQYSNEKVDYRTSVMFFNIIPPERLLSSYIILANKEVQLGEENHVNSGWVGLTDTGRIAQFKKNSSVFPGFVKADKINAHPTAYLPNIMEGPAEVTLPDMEYSIGNGSNGKVVVPNNTNTIIWDKNVDIEIGENCNVSIRGNILGKIDIGSGSQVSFSEINLDLIDLLLRKAKINSQTVVTFTKQAQVRVKQSVRVEEYCKITSYDPQVFPMAFYIGEEEGGHQGDLTIHAEGTSFLAGAFVPRGQIHIISNATNSNPCNLTGQFIAEKVNSDAKYVIWNLRHCFTEGMQQFNPNQTLKNLNGVPVYNQQEISCQVYPIPSNGLINVSIVSPGKDKFNIIVYNLLGAKVYEQNDIDTDGRLEKQIDLQSFPEGIYFIMTMNKQQRNIQRFLISR